MGKTSLLSIIFILVFNLSFAQTKEEKKKNKEETALKEYSTTKSLVEAGEYQFIATWATTQKGQRINLTSNLGYLKIKKDSIRGDLPYFGVAQAIPYSGDGGIKFNNVNVNYQIDYNDKKQIITILFKANEKSESLNLILSVFRSGNASLNISSSNRDSINYDGKVTELDQS